MTACPTYDFCTLRVDRRCKPRWPETGQVAPARLRRLCGRASPLAQEQRYTDLPSTNIRSLLRRPTQDRGQAVDYGWSWSREAAFSRTRARKMRPDVAVIHARCSRISSRAEVGYETKASQSTFEIERFAVNARPSRRNMLAVVQSVHSTRSSLEKDMLPPNQRRRTRPMPWSTRGQKNLTYGCRGSAWASDAHSRPRLRLLSVQDKNRRGRGSYEVHASKSARDRGAERANYR